MTLVLVLRTIEGIVIASDSLSTATEIREINGKEKTVRYHIYHRKKISQLGNSCVVHAGLSIVNGKTINQIIQRLPSINDNVHLRVKEVQNEFEKELKKDPACKKFAKDEVILSLGIVGYKDNNPFVYRIIFLGTDNEKEPYDLMISTKAEAFEPPYYGIDYFGDYEFVRSMILMGKKYNLLKPFEILTLNEAMELVRTLIRFLVDFQKFMIEATVAFPVESATITHEYGFKWIDQMDIPQFTYEDDTH